MALVLVTGSATGLGLGAARELISGGHDVVAHVRTPDRLPDELGTAAAEVVVGDLASLAESTRLAGEVNRLGRLDAVIHNAGVFDGPDLFAVNIVAPYVLSCLLTPPGRTIMLSSSMHLSGSAELGGLDFTAPAKRHHPYNDSKLQLTALAFALARLRPDPISHAVDPGWVPTRMGGPNAPDDLAAGHRTQVWLATAELASITPRTAGYWHHFKARSPHPATIEETFQSELLSRLAAHTGVELH